MKSNENDNDAVKFRVSMSFCVLSVSGSINRHLESSLGSFIISKNRLSRHRPRVFCIPLWEFHSLVFSMGIFFCIRPKYL